MNFGKIDRIALFGGSWLAAALCRRLAAQRQPFNLFTSPRHLEDVVEADGKRLREVVRELGIPVCATDDINAELELRAFVGPSTLGLAVGAAWGFSKETAELFSGRLVDFMGIALPKFRGGAHYTWQVLSGTRQGSCNIQLVHGGPETFHRGEILKRRDYFFPAEARVPQDYFDAAVPEEIAFLEEFLAEVRAMRDFPLQPLQDGFSSYFPFLYTLKHGFIDWRWTLGEIERFICAFDRPYAGASTFLADRRVFLKACHADYSEGAFHPFQAGLVYRRVGNGLFIAARGGALMVGSVVDETGSSLLENIEVGRRLYTPQSVLDAAFQFDAVYDARGVVGGTTREVS